MLLSKTEADVKQEELIFFLKIACDTIRNTIQTPIKKKKKKTLAV